MLLSKREAKNIQTECSLSFRSAVARKEIIYVLELVG
jgi:hypothetical protein